MVETNHIAIVGAGRGGLALLKVLLNIPGNNLKYICDTNHTAVGILYAREHKLNCVYDYKVIASDPEINLIFESTGQIRVFDELNRIKLPSISLIGSMGAKTIFNLIDGYNEANQNLMKYKIGLERRILERTDDLEKANAELEVEKSAYEKLHRNQLEINAEKSRYLLHTAHQLKAPFAAIQSYVDLITEGYAGDVSPETRQILEKIRVRCELLSNNIAEMLELAKLQTSVRNDIIMDIHDLHEILSSVIERLNIVATTKKIRINLNIDPGPLPARCNEKQILTLLSVLIENAIQYSRESSSIDVIMKRLEDGKVFISIKDYGIGISKENISKIFDDYFRANNAVEMQVNGSGLGLAIAREITNIHQSSLNVESVLNQGSTFSFTL